MFLKVMICNNKKNVILDYMRTIKFKCYWGEKSEGDTWLRLHENEVKIVRVTTVGKEEWRGGVDWLLILERDNLHKRGEKFWAFFCWLFQVQNLLD